MYLQQSGYVFAFTLTAAAGFGADSAMFMHAGMLLAFRGAQAACGSACLNLVFQRILRNHAQARKQSTGSMADIGAVLIKPDAADKSLYLLFPQAGIGTGDAGLSAYI